MQVPLHVGFQNMAVSDAVEARVREHVEALDRLFPDIVSCRVTIELDARQHPRGRLYQVRIVMAVPGQDIVVDRHVGRNDHTREDVHAAVNDAFDAARRQLQDHVRRLRAETKTHEPPAHGRILRVFADHAFIAASDGREIYMHRNAVANDKFDALREGDEVRFHEHDGEGLKGPQASTVVPVGKHHIDPAE